MAKDFREMASKAKAAYEANVATQRAKDAAERQQRSKTVDASIATLQSSVLPLVQRAKADFAANGIDSKIITDFDVKNYVSGDPSITFQCLGPKRQSDGWQFQAVPVFFSANGETITVGVGKYGFDNRPSEQLGAVHSSESEPLICRAVQKSLDAYFEELKKGYPGI